MWKQLLAYALAFSMAFEAPATVYAAEQNGLTETVSEYGYESAESETPSVAREDSVENPADEPGGGSGKESDVEEDGALEGTEGEETDIVGDEVGEDDENETDVPDDGSEDQDEVPEGSDSESDEKDSSEETDASDDNVSADEETVTDEESDAMETESETEAEADTEALTSALAVSAGITELDYAEASSAGVEVYAPYDSSQWYSFTAPKDGNYLFYTDEQTEYNTSDLSYVYLYDDVNQNYYRYGYFWSDIFLSLVSGDMTEGETIYLQMYSQAAGGKTFTLKVAEQTAPESTGSGSTTVTVGDGIDITVTPTAGYKYLKVNAKLTDTGAQPNYETYDLYTFCQNVDTGDYGYRPYYDVSLSRYSTDSNWFINVDMGSTYNLYYVIRNSEGGLIKFFAGAEPLTTGITSEGVYIHDSECDEHSITMDLEPIANSSMYCYYAPADGSEEEKKFSNGIYRWNTITIGGLKSGTAYVLRFCDNFGGKEYARATFTTLGEPAAVSSVDYKAELSDDFTTLTLSAEMADYTGESLYAYFHYRFVDALGVERVGSERAYLTNTSDDGNIHLEITLEDRKAAAFLADSEYDIEMWLSFPQDYLTLNAETCQLETPRALYSSDDISFVIKDNDTNSSPGMAFKVTVNGAPPQVDSLIFYRPLNSLQYTAVKYAADMGISGDSTMKPGDYEVALFIGGVKIENTWSVRDDSGLSLIKVESGKNEDGAYDVVRTLKVVTNGDEEPSGTYYLHLAYSTESMDSYSVMDSYIELDEGNGYQATVYSAALSLSNTWLQPDTDYYLRWTIGNSSYSNSSASNAAYAYYEKIHTNPAKITVESVRSTSSTQEFMITLDSADVVNMSAYNRYIWLYGCVKKSDADENTYGSMGGCDLSKYNNYSGSIYLYDLEAGTDYDLSLRDNSGNEYQKLSFTTPADSRTLSEPEAIVTASSAVLKAVFSGNTEYKQSYVHFFYKTKDAQDWTKADSINVSGYTTRNCSVTLTNLVRGTEYEYAAVLSEDSICVDPDAVTKDSWKVTGNFETAPATAPVSVTLSQTELYLNAAYPNMEGSGWKQLKAVVTPDTAEQGFEWESSDPSVASVSANGLVTAVGTGETDITVRSLYAKEGEEPASAQCKVVVGNYKVGYTTDENNDVVLVDILPVYKGNSTEEKYMLYQIDGNNMEPLSSSQFSVDSTNPHVVTWKDGVITAGNVGSAKLVFAVSEGEKAGVCAYLPVTVSAQGKGFDILGFNSSYTRYPAIKEDGSAQYTLAYTPGIIYTAKVEISPSETYSAGNFDWKITDQDGNETAETTAIATVSNGVVTPKSAGTVYLTVKATKEDTLYYEKTRTVVLNFKALPEQTTGTSIYALANISSKIGDVAFPAGTAEEVALWKGWSWKYPDTPLVTNGINKDSYPFEAVYQGEEFYPCETTVNVYIAKVTGMSASDDHSKAVEIGSASTDGTEADTMILTVNSVYQGTMDTSGYPSYDVEIPAIQGIKIEQITPDSNHAKGIYRYKVTAEKKGSYTLKPVIQVEYKDSAGNTKTKKLASTAYKIKAVEGAQAASVAISLAPETEGMSIEKINGQDGVVIDITKKKVSDITPFTLNAVVKDRNGGELNTALTWKTTDSSVATVKASTDNSHVATVTVKGEGHAILTAIAKDDAGREGTLKVEIRNHKPRVNVSKVTMNTAFDYTNSYGLSLASSTSGAVEIVPVYGEGIRDVAIYENEVVSTGFKAYSYGTYQWVIGPSDGSLTNGTYKCTLLVTTTSGEYDYPLTVTVTEKKAKLTAKAYNTVNLFYTSESAEINLNISGANSGIQSVSWSDGTGFAYSYYSSISSTQKRLYFRQDNIRLKKGRLADPNDAKGTLTIGLSGYKEPYTINNVAIKWKYKKPTIVTQDASTTVVPSAGKNRNRFYLYNKTEKRTVSYNESYVSAYYYNGAVCGNENVTLSPSGYYVYYDYNGNKSKGSEKIKLTLTSGAWRDPVEVTHTIKFATPTAYLTIPTVTINTTQIGTAYTAVMIKNAYSNDAPLNCDDIIIEGKDPKAQKLLDRDLLEITQSVTYAYQITVNQNRTRTMAHTEADIPDLSIKDGTYTYKVTPYYTDDQGNRKALNTVNLKVKVTSKAITAKTKTSGSLDLVQQSTTSHNYVRLSPVFNNIGNAYYVSNMELCGEYSEYFKLTRYEYSSLGDAYLTIANDSKLKSGQKYKLSVKYTVQMSSGDTFTVMGAAFTVKPKQTAPKVTVSNNNQVMYAAADTVNRSYTVTISSSWYTIESVSGSLDCNKDGIPDITVSGTTGSRYSNLTVRITDRDGVITSTNAKGKTYSIPVVLRLRGADGISKDVKTSIKVTVKR